jgi:hypothetical protein
MWKAEGGWHDSPLSHPATTLWGRDWPYDGWWAARPAIPARRAARPDSESEPLAPQAAATCIRAARKAGIMLSAAAATGWHPAGPGV